MLMEIGMAGQLIDQRAGDGKSALHASLWFPKACVNARTQCMSKWRHAHNVKGTKGFHDIRESANDIVSLFDDCLLNATACRCR
jgi:hypothetical protein